MKFEIRGKNIELTDALKEYTTKRLSKLEKYIDNVKEAKVALSVGSEGHKVEVTIPIRFEELDYDETREWINLETAAMKRWRKGDPTGFFAICAEDVRYFDPFVKHRIDGLECLKKEILGRTFRTRFDVMEFIDPRVVIYGQKAAVLFYRFFSTTLHPNGSVRLRIPWNCSVIYRRSRERWKVVHTHRSYINGRQ